MLLPVRIHVSQAVDCLQKFGVTHPLFQQDLALLDDTWLLFYVCISCVFPSVIHFVCLLSVAADDLESPEIRASWSI